MSIELSLLSIGISVVVAIVLIFSLIIHHRDISLRQRPWIVGLRTETRSDVELIKGEITFHLVNRGPVPAFDIKIKSYTGSAIPNDNMDNYREADFEPIDLGPLEEHEITFELSKGVIDPATNMGTVYYGLFIEYLDLHKKKKTYNLVGHFINNVNQTDKLKIK